MEAYGWAEVFLEVYDHESGTEGCHPRGTRNRVVVHAGSGVCRSSEKVIRSGIVISISHSAWDGYQDVNTLADLAPSLISCHRDGYRMQTRLDSTINSYLNSAQVVMMVLDGGL